ncbi:MAG TPA: hypothetical protein VD971_00525 [Phycisphaerales bacterium]|nr:hypothetical protein [Phycisphaerales bacterium]
MTTASVRGLNHSTRFAACAITLAALAAVSAQAQWTVTRLSIEGTRGVYLLDGRHGEAVGYGGNDAWGMRAFGWTQIGSAPIDLSPPQTLDVAVAYGVDDGVQVGCVILNTHEEHAVLWTGVPDTWVDLNPLGSTYSHAYGVGSDEQVGVAMIDDRSHASLWRGSAESWVDLHPQGAESSFATAAWNGQQAGHVWTNGAAHAALWSGSADSFVSLHPSGAFSSGIWRLHSGQQVGSVQFTEGGPSFASVWSGSADSWVNLNPPGAARSAAFAVFGGWQGGNALINGVEHAGIWRGTADSWVPLPFPSDGFAYTGAIVRGIWTDGDTLYAAGNASELPRNTVPVLWSRPLSARGCDTLDFNRDGLFPDAADLTDFLAAFGGAPCDTCGDLDFNNDGLMPDNDDIASFFSVVGGGPC